MEDIESAVKILQINNLGGGIRDESITPTIVAGRGDLRGEAKNGQLGTGHIHHPDAVQGQKVTRGVCMADGIPSPHR